MYFPHSQVAPNFYSNQYADPSCGCFPNEMRQELWESSGRGCLEGGLRVGLTPVSLGV